MYLGFYGLEREPFHITPDPEFLFLSPSHKEAFAAIVYGVEQRKGFVALTGEVGTGKTTVLRAYLKRIEKSAIRPIYLFNPDLTFEQLLAMVLKSMGIEPKQKQTAPQMLERLHWALINEFRQNRNVALIIDEAQNMPVETLEKLRMLSNLETTEDKLIQIVLVGQPELQRKLDLYSLRQLKQRIAVKARVRALTRAEGESYVQHRLSLAGCTRPDIFSPAAVRALLKRSKGNPRVLNILCDNCLITGFGYQSESVTPKIVKEVAADVLGRTRYPVPRWAWATLAAALLVGVPAAFYLQLPPDLPVAPPLQAAPPPAAPVPERAAPVEANTATPPGLDPAKIALEKMTKVVEAAKPAAPAPPAAETPAPPGAVQAINPEPVKAEAAVAESPAVAPATPPAEVPKPAEAGPEKPPEQETAKPPAPESAVAAKPAEAPEKPQDPEKPVEEVAAKPAAPVTESGTENNAAEQAAPRKSKHASSHKARPDKESKPAEAAPAEKPVEKPAEVSKPEAAAEAVAKAEPPAPPAQAAPEAKAEAPAPPTPPVSPEASQVAAAPSESKAAPEAAKAEAPAPPEAGDDGSKRKVSRGDSLSKLVAQVYGHANDALIEHVKQINPQVKDANLIYEGDTLVFPASPTGTDTSSNADRSSP